ncbi:hypothetical protein [Ferrovibrio terrae]|uniref:hypothetical protein n=1 Tax=Ferrovibrio terrae TaxID=2594003 RepID=UPI003137EB13
MSDLGPLAPTAPPVTTTAGTSTAPAASPQGNAQTAAGVLPAPPQGQPSQGQTGQGVSGQPQQTPASPNTILQGASPQGGGAATEIASSANELTKGGQIAAQVVARDNMTLLVRTAAGNTLAITNLAQALEQANLAVLNAALRLQLNPENPQQATVVSVNGTALQPPVPALAQPPTAAQLAIAVSPPQPGGSAAPVLPQPGQTLTAVVVTPPVGTAAPALPPGSQLQVVVQSVTLPTAIPTAPTVPAAQTPPPNATPAAPATPATPAAVPPQLPAAAVPAAPAIANALVQAQAQSQTPAVTPPQTPPLTPQTPLQPAILQQAVISQPQPQPHLQPTGAQPFNLPSANLLAPGAASQVLTGIVTGQGQAGQVLVATPQGVLSLNLPQALPPGTQLALELAAITKPPTPTPTALGPAPLAGILTRLQGGWPLLQQTLDAVRAADPALAQRLQTELLPQPNARLASSALQFMAAAAAGSAQAWLGSEAVRKLEQSGRGELLKKLDDDFRELGRLNQRQGDNDWQALVMPMMIGGKVEAIHIFMRRRKDAKKQQKQTRFIIDFDLESTGPIQFDGFVSVKQLDLILRSETEFGPAFRLDVSAIFEEALAITGMVGSLRFHDREKPLPWPSPELESRGPSTELKA